MQQQKILERGQLYHQKKVVHLYDFIEHANIRKISMIIRLSQNISEATHSI